MAAAQASSSSEAHAEVAQAHNVPQTHCTVIMTKYGQPPAYKPKRRRVIIRSDAIYLLSVPDAKSTAAAVIKRTIPLSKIKHMELRNGDTQVLFRIINEHDLYLSTDEEEVRHRLIEGLDAAMRATSIQITAKRKAARVFDLDRDGGKLVKLAKDLVSYPSMEDKIKLRCALMKMDKYPQPPYSLDVWDSTLKKLNKPPDLQSRADHGIPAALFQFLEGVHVSLAAMATLTSVASQPPPERPGGESPRPAQTPPMDCLMVFTPSHLKFFTTKVPVQQQLLSIYDVAGIVIDFPNDTITLAQHAGARHQVKLTKQAIGPTFETSNISVIARCFVCLQERHGYTCRIIETGPQQASNRKGPASPVMKPDRSKSVALLSAQSMDEEKLKKLVLDYKAPHGEINRRFMAPVTLLARQCFRLTSRMNWEPRVVVLTVNGILLCSDDCSVRRAIDYESIGRIIITKHWQCDGLSLVIPDGFDSVLKAHEGTPKHHKMGDIAAVISMRAPQAKVEQVTWQGKESLKAVVGKDRNLRKPDNFESPARMVERAKNSPRGTNSGSPMAGSPTSKSFGGSPMGPNDSLSAPPAKERGDNHGRANTMQPTAAASSTKQQQQQPTAAADSSADAPKNADGTPRTPDQQASRGSVAFGDIEQVESRAFDTEDPQSPGTNSNASPGNRSMVEGNYGSFATHIRNEEAAHQQHQADADAEERRQQDQVQEQESRDAAEAQRKQKEAPEQEPSPAAAHAEPATAKTASLSSVLQEGQPKEDPPAVVAAPQEEPPVDVEPIANAPSSSAKEQHQQQPSAAQEQAQPSETSTPAAAAAAEGTEEEVTVAATSRSLDMDSAAANATAPDDVQTSTVSKGESAAANASHTAETPAADGGREAAQPTTQPEEQPERKVETPQNSIVPVANDPSPTAAAVAAAAATLETAAAAAAAVHEHAELTSHDEPRTQQSGSSEAAATDGAQVSPAAATVAAVAESPRSTSPAAMTEAAHAEDSPVAMTATGSSGESRDARALPTSEPTAGDVAAGDAQQDAAPEPANKTESDGESSTPAKADARHAEAQDAAASPVAATTGQQDGGERPAAPVDEASPRAAPPSRAPPVIPKLPTGSLPRGSSTPQVSARDGDWTPARKSASIRVSSWPVPSPRRQVSTADAGRSLDREGSVMLVEDREARAIVAESRRQGQLDDPAAVADPHPEVGHTWLAFRIRMPDGEMAIFYSDKEFISLMQRFSREHRKYYSVDGPSASKNLCCVCAQGPAVFTFTLSFFLFALEQPEAVIRRSSVLLREPEDELEEGEIEWIEIPIPAFCALVREGKGTREMAMACIRDVCCNIVDESGEAVRDERYVDNADDGAATA